MFIHVSWSFERNVEKGLTILEVKTEPIAIEDLLIKDALQIIKVAEKFKGSPCEIDPPKPLNIKFFYLSLSFLELTISFFFLCLQFALNKELI